MKTDKRIILSILLAVALVASLLPLTPPARAVSTTVVINEIDYDQPSTDTSEFIELRNVSAAAINLDNYAVELVNGSGGGAVPYQTIDLPNVNLAAGDYFVICGNAATTVNCDLDVAPDTNLIQNGAPDAVGLRLSGVLVDVVSYEGDSGAPYKEGSGVGLLDDPLLADFGLSRCPDGLDTDQNNVDFLFRIITPGTANDCPSGDLAPSVSSTTPPSGATDAALDANITVNFSEPVNVTGSWFAIFCNNSGAHTATVSGGPTSFTLDPDSDFTDGETCTVTVSASSVTDLDADDPPDNMAADFSWSFSTTAPPTPIYVIQGDGLTSPLAGTRQTTTGVVTVILSNGFFMQDPLGDGDPSTSDGIFVFTGASLARTFAPGDQVAVTGTVVEFRLASRPRDLTLTELSTPVTVVKTGLGAPLPAPVPISDRPDTEIDPDGIHSFEALEGMLVEIDDPKVVGPTNVFGEFLVVAVADAGNTTAAGNLLVELLGPDDVDYNPERIMVDDEARLAGGTGGGTRINSPQVQVRVGDQAAGQIVGALDYQFSNYRVQANHPLSAVLASSVLSSPVGNLRPPQAFEGRVATFNVLNLFDCVNAPGKDDPSSCNAAALAALERQLGKLARAFEEELGSPELLIIEEAENTEVLTGDANGFVPGTSIPALLPRVSGSYDAVSFDASDERGIEVAFVFNTDRVTLHDAFLATTLLPDTGGLFNGTVFPAGREPLVGFFTLDGMELIVVGNHLKSKGGPQFGIDPAEAGDDPLYGAFQPPTRWTEPLRHLQADYLRALVDLLLVLNPGARILVGGDLNDFQFAEPGEGLDTVARIKDSATDPLTNVIDRIPEDERYTFIFEGNSQVLDHMLLNAGLAARLRDQGIAHFNADFPVSFGSDPTVTFRSSDHDPLVAYFCTDVPAPSLAVSVSPDMLWPPNHQYVTVPAKVNASDNADPGVVPVLVSVTSTEPDNGLGDGDQPDDIVIVDDFTFNLRAERSGLGRGRVYTITYQATDACGNSARATATVRVPHSQRP